MTITSVCFLCTYNTSMNVNRKIYDINMKTNRVKHDDQKAKEILQGATGLQGPHSSM